jgi:hypothetical protein
LGDVQLSPVNEFTGGHWPEPNVVAYMRVNDHTLPSGEKALHVEEWQSDWAIANRSGEKTIDGLKPVGPSHPLVDNWQDLMARRTLKEAVDGGYDRLTWTTGQQQADRYDLAQYLNEVQAAKREDGWTVWAFKRNGDPVGSDFGELYETPQALESAVGKDLAKKIISETENKPYTPMGTEEPQVPFTGLDLKVGGEWATKLYNESMVNRFNKMGKRYGVKVEDVPLTVGTEKIVELRWTDPYGGDVIRETVPLRELEKYKQRAMDWAFHGGNELKFKTYDIDPKNKLYTVKWPSDMDPDDLQMLPNFVYGRDLKAAQLRINQQANKFFGDTVHVPPLEIKLEPYFADVNKIHSIKITPEMKESIRGSKFHPLPTSPARGRRHPRYRQRLKHRISTPKPPRLIRRTP